MECSAVGTLLILIFCQMEYIQRKETKLEMQGNRVGLLNLTGLWNRGKAVSKDIVAWLFSKKSGFSPNFVLFVFEWSNFRQNNLQDNCHCCNIMLQNQFSLYNLWAVLQMQAVCC